MSEDTIDEVFDEWGKDDRPKEKKRWKKCFICGESYLEDEGCCIID